MCGVESKDIIAWTGFIIVILGWLFSRWKDRTHEIFKERLKNRLDMYDCLFDALLPFANNKDGSVDLDSDKLSEKLSFTRTKIQLYEYKDEIDEYELFIKKLKNNDINGVNCSLQKLSPMMVNKLRKELGY